MFRAQLITFAVAVTALMSDAAATQILPIDFDLAKVPSKGRLYGQTITVDTRDQTSCAAVRERLSADGRGRDFSALCTRDSDRPFVTVVSLRESPYSDNQDEYSRTLVKFGPKGVQHANDTRNVLILGAVGVGRYFVAGLPKTWENVHRRSIGERWHDNIRSGPHFDDDNWGTNYIEHPMAGSIYYTIARHSGFSALESFGFAVFSSTFIWEYGYEAVYEKPSYQDLVITPVIGSLIGEVFYQIDRSIEAHDGRVLGSPFLGRTIQLITNPGYYLSEGIDALIGEDWIKSAELQWAAWPTGDRRRFGPAPSSTALGLRLRLQFM